MSACLSAASKRSSVSTAIASICVVPLFSAKPSLQLKRTGDKSNFSSTLRAGKRSPLKITSPKPSSGSAKCDSGAKSPLAPTEPNSGTTGVMPKLSKASISLSTRVRMPECPPNSVLRRITSIARATSTGNGVPTQTAWLTIKLCCNSSIRLSLEVSPDAVLAVSASLSSAFCSVRRRSAANSRSALEPNPVVTPYKGTPRLSSASKNFAALVTRRSAFGASSTARPR